MVGEHSGACVHSSLHCSQDDIGQTTQQASSPRGEKKTREERETKRGKRRGARWGVGVIESRAQELLPIL